MENLARELQKVRGVKRRSGDTYNLSDRITKNYGCALPKDKPYLPRSHVNAQEDSKRLAQCVEEAQEEVRTHVDHALTCSL